MSEEFCDIRTEDHKINARMKKDKKPQTEDARTSGFSQSTVSKELATSSAKKDYPPKRAQGKTIGRKDSKRARGSVVTEYLAYRVVVRLEAKHSPEQISGTLALIGKRASPIYNPIGQCIWSGGQQHCNLRISGPHRYCRRCKANLVKIPNWRDISERPGVVEQRTRHGDWEADLIEGAGGTGYIPSFYGRKSRYGKLIKLGGKTRIETSRGIIAALAKNPVKTITNDNGLEFARHEEMVLRLVRRGISASSTRSGNGLVRQYSPKGCYLSEVDQATMSEAVAELKDSSSKINRYKSSSHYSILLAA